MRRFELRRAHLNLRLDRFELAQVTRNFVELTRGSALEIMLSVFHLHAATGLRASLERHFGLSTLSRGHR